MTERAETMHTAFATISDALGNVFMGVACIVGVFLSLACTAAAFFLALMDKQGWG
jgi:hypothetical protein